MAQHITRIPYDEFARDVPGFLDRVAKTGDRVEVLWENGSVALVRPGSTRADEAMSAVPEAWKVKTDLSQVRPPTPEQIARHHETLERVRERGKELVAQRGGKPAPSNVDFINELREERSSELEERSLRTRSE